jgi:cobyric acid synthase
VYRYVRFAVMGTSLAASDACIRRSSAEASDDRAKAQSADSALRRARIEVRPATQAVDFDERAIAIQSRGADDQARFSGVQVTVNGANYTIQIRAPGRSASNEPLVVIDGTRRTTADLRSVVEGRRRIEIMKDAASSTGRAARTA